MSVAEKGHSKLVARPIASVAVYAEVMAISLTTAAAAAAAKLRCIQCTKEIVIESLRNR